MDDQNPENIENSEILVSEEVSIETPKMFKVVMLNDDYTPMDFVVNVLESIFERNHTEAMKIMLEVHQNGHATAGVYPKSIAETKVVETTREAKSQQYPLQCKMETE